MATTTTTTPSQDLPSFVTSAPPAASAASASTDDEDPNWFVPCVEEELYLDGDTGTRREKGSMGAATWRPKVEEVVALYDQITASEQGILKLNWSCPYGRRPPSPGEDEEYETDEEEAAAAAAASAASRQQAAVTSAMSRAKIGSRGHQASASKADDFDFDDEMATPPVAATSRESLRK